MLSVRPAIASDYAHFPLLFRELGVDDPLPSKEAWERDFLPLMFIAVDGEHVLGYVYLRLFEASGHVVHVSTHPHARRRGVGSALMHEAAKQFRARGLSRWYLNVKEENAGAIALYQRFGMAVVQRGTVLRIPWSVATLPLGPGPAPKVRQIQTSDIGALETRFGFPPGQLALLLAQEGFVGLMAEGPSREDPLGLARFSPTFPGVYPLRARTIEAASALFGALEAFALADHSWFQLFLEGQLDLADALIAKGAQVKMRTLRMEGDVPV